MSYISDDRLEELKQNSQGVLVRIHAVGALLLSILLVLFCWYHGSAYDAIVVVVHGVSFDPWLLLRISLGLSVVAHAYAALNAQSNHRLLEYAGIGAIDITILTILIGFKYLVTIVTVIALYCNALASYHAIDIALTLLPTKREKLLSVMTGTAFANLSVVSIILFYYLSHEEHPGKLYCWALAVAFVLYSFIEWGFALSHSISTGFFQGDFYNYLMGIHKICYRLTFYLIGFTAVLGRAEVKPLFALGDILLLSAFVPFICLFFSVFALYPSTMSPQELNKKADVSYISNQPTKPAKPAAPSSNRVKFVL